MENKQKAQKEIERLEEVQRKLLAKMQTKSDVRSKKTATQNVIVDSSELQEYRINAANIFELWKEIDSSFLFGGQELCFYDFIPNLKTGEIFLPAFYTLDEFFKNVE